LHDRKHKVRGVNWARFDPIPGRHGKNGKHSLPDPRTTRLDRIPEKRNRAPEGAANHVLAGRLTDQNVVEIDCEAS
jgi:hypothetical protein